jgi:hypothetical protein
MLDYSCPDGPGPLGRHENGPKKPGTSPERHAGRRSTGQPGTGVGPGLGRHLGTVARHAARHGFWASPMWPDSLLAIPI